MKLPRQGMTREAVLERMRERKAADADWRGGRTFSLVYPAGEDVDDLQVTNQDLCDGHGLPRGRCWQIVPQVQKRLGQAQEQIRRQAPEPETEQSAADIYTAQYKS